MEQGTHQAHVLVRIPAERVRALLRDHAVRSAARNWPESIPEPYRSRLPRRPRARDFRLGEPVLLRSLMAFDPEEARARLERMNAPGALEHHLLTVQMGVGDHYLVPLYYRGRKIAEVWVPADTVCPKERANAPFTARDLIFFRISRETRPLALPEELRRAHPHLKALPAVPPELFWLASKRFGPTPFYGWESERGLSLYEAYLPSRRAFLAIPLASGRRPEVAYHYQGRPIQLQEEKP